MSERLTERTVKIVLGDWSGDGHGKTDTTVVTLRGDDVSDAALNNSYRSAVEETGVDLMNDVFSRYEDSTFDMSRVEKVWEAGKVARVAAHKTAELAGKGSFCSAGIFFDEDYPEPTDEDSYDFSAVELLLSFIGYAVPNFSWTIVDIPTLIGGPETVLSDGNSRVTSFGYGLFF